MVGKYPNLSQQGRIGKLISKNRIKYAATETNFPFGDGFVGDREIAYMEAQAKGGAGIVTTQGAYPDREGAGKGFKGMMAIYDDRFIPGLARIADVIRNNGALSCLQILHCGREGGVELDYSLMPSVVPQKLSYFKPPREITKEEIKKAVKDHVDAAKRARKAGFDMIELSGIVGYLISTFISRYTNKRSDEYGGNLQQRCRLMVEIIESIKSMVDDMPVGIRLCGHELLDDRDGNTQEESIESFAIAEEAGADYVSVTIGWHESSQSVITRDVPMGYWLPVAEAVKRNVSVPVMMAFRQFLPHLPEKAITNGQIDFWEMCRPMIADPELPRKALEGREDEIIPCIACNLCFSRLYYHQPIMCTVRPSLGHENDKNWGYYGFASANRRKKITIIGGGPAGLQCAAIAAQKGHSVTIYEKAEQLGGNILLAARVDEGAKELLRPINMLERLCNKVGVNFYLGTEYSTSMIESDMADDIVISTGAKSDLIPGVLNPQDVIDGRIIPGKKVIIMGGNGVGLGIAVFLLQNGDYTITVIEEGSKPGRDVNPFYLWQYIKLIKERGVTILTRSKIVDVKKDQVRVDIASGDSDTIYADSVITAFQYPNRELENIGFKLNKNIHIIGDAKKPRRLNNAIHDGYKLGMVL